MKWEDNMRPDGKRWACPYCGKCIGGLFEMGKHLQEHSVVYDRVLEDD